MPQHVLNTPVCRDCDGFPVVAITTGTRAPDGTRVLLRVVCLACKGTGHTPRAALVRAGR
jgi:DnaJ-class molecular chaperone